MLGRITDWFARQHAIKALTKDQFLRDMTLFIGGLFTDPAIAKNDFVIGYIQRMSKKTKEAIAEQVWARVMQIHASDDRVLACRQWLREIVLVHARLKVLFTSEKDDIGGGRAHPCFVGLYERIGDVIKADFYDEYRQAGSLDEAIEQLRAQSWRAHFDTKVADYMRHQLGDYIDSKQGEDWFQPYFYCTCAWWENTFRKTLNLAPRCDALELMAEQTAIESNLLKKYKNPLDEVERAKPKERS